MNRHPSSSFVTNHPARFTSATEWFRKKPRKLLIKCRIKVLEPIYEAASRIASLGPKLGRHPSILAGSAFIFGDTTTTSNGEDDARLASSVVARPRDKHFRLRDEARVARQLLPLPLECPREIRTLTGPNRPWDALEAFKLSSLKASASGDWDAVRIAASSCRYFPVIQTPALCLSTEPLIMTQQCRVS
ncbi:hypothetical protein O181_003629 [Austropuccinia psidii MF-1]|uniref:Uncharacterized protein n=1 Tax=Austropuccinia psidii MF-1 TaxID=1389203 RepID=A0A9Q3GE17_9BASI|nr:hypothetical protein [Austropuccinia psidii MF-1]